MNSWSLKACAIIAPFLSFFELIQIRTEHMQPPCEEALNPETFFGALRYFCVATSGALSWKYFHSQISAVTSL